VQAILQFVIESIKCSFDPHDIGSEENGQDDGTLPITFNPGSRSRAAPMLRRLPGLTVVWISLVPDMRNVIWSNARQAWPIRGCFDKRWLQ
jgi:hypothetical protein